MFTRRGWAKNAVQTGISGYGMFTQRLRIGRQFSLRFLLLLVSAAALVSATWRPFGAAGIALALFVVLSVTTLFALPRKRKRAFFVAWSAVFGPFVAMATYTTLYVSCSHCKSTAWGLLPCAPGLVPVELARHGLDLPRVSDSVAFALSLSLSVAMLFATAVLIRKTSWWRIIVLVSLLLYETFAASVVLGMIRM